jgi:IMP cyclohydrolase
MQHLEEFEIIDEQFSETAYRGLGRVWPVLEAGQPLVDAIETVNFEKDGYSPDKISAVIDDKFVS